ncbi:hypothetical protein V8B97DRAFT_896129 [Scleroderma yunnanense]
MLSRTLHRRISNPSVVYARNASLAFSTPRAIAVVRPARKVVNHPTTGCQLHLCRRALTTPAPHTNASEFRIEEYHALSDATMTTLFEELEALLDEFGNSDMEVDYHSGVLTLHLGLHGTYVINKQPPNQQIWLSSPISGPKRYDYVPTSDDWRCSRDGEELGALMERELSGMLGQEVSLNLGCVSDLA